MPALMSKGKEISNCKYGKFNPLLNDCKYFLFFGMGLVIIDCMTWNTKKKLVVSLKYLFN